MSPEQSPEDVEGQMRDTRRHMSGQMHALEDKVAGMAQGAADSADRAVRGAADALATATEQVRAAPAAILAAVRRVLDVGSHVRRHPWLAVGCAAALGFAYARLVTRADDRSMCGLMISRSEMASSSEPS